MPLADGFSSASLSVRMQKKIAGKLSSRTLARHLINDPTSRVLDNVYVLLKIFYNKHQAEKVANHIMHTLTPISIRSSST